MTTKNILRFAIALLIAASPAAASAQTSDEGFIFGRVFTADNEVYSGVIRWGKEEIYWSDMFNSTKTENPNIRYLSSRDLDYVENDRDNWRSFTKWNGRSEYKHQFVCRFGDIQSLSISGRKTVVLTLKNGEIVELRGGSNDIGTRLRVYDVELGELTIKWNRIERIEFSETPSTLDYKFGDPVYGTVNTRRGSFTGLVIWDKDERIGTDELDGESRNGDLEIPFRNIARIEKYRSGSRVIVKSGRELYLTGTNDVDSDNRGIIVTDEDLNRYEIPWSEFRDVSFDPKPSTSGRPYSGFAPPKQITGSVTLRGGQVHTGRIVYDLDESYGFEVLEGEDGGIEYNIPFFNIAKIAPRGYNSAEVTLKGGKMIRLNESQDVSDRNDGILVFGKEGSDPVYLPWTNIDVIEFD